MFLLQIKSFFFLGLLECDTSFDSRGVTGNKRRMSVENNYRDWAAYKEETGN